MQPISKYGEVKILFVNSKMSNSIHTWKFDNNKSLVNTYINSFRAAPGTHTFVQRPLNSRNTNYRRNYIKNKVIPYRKRKAQDPGHIAELQLVQQIYMYLEKGLKELQAAKKKKNIENLEAAKKKAKKTANKKLLGHKAQWAKWSS